MTKAHRNSCLLLAASLLFVSASLQAAEKSADQPAEPCDAIRTRIGLAPLADPDFLRVLAARSDCAFTAAEFYRAAYGDRPLPPPEQRRQYRHRRDDGDDD